MFERKQTKKTSAETPDAAPAPARSKRPTGGPAAMIGSNVRITGDIESAEDLLIEGEVSGTVKLTEHELVVGAAGRVRADIEARSVRVEGEVQGDVKGRERVLIAETGNVEGNVSAPRVVLEDGGRFKGSIDMGGARDTAAAKAGPHPAAADTEAKTEAKAEAKKVAPELAGVTKAG